ncbi:dolichol-phosphate mannosyltransferase [Nitrosospira multiformis]|uniref:Dolichol-phosphate mannosyltransferase n=1 Tax=Nitrosospira multiformis TaxID=1231 RepID=A0A1H8KWL8_9PROT|nr:glycosyltransferase [Nitrosospira multiformis]SEN96798.1 dolichol-phosphate mannosyltransferase [Nitrosospira multiformis]
MNRTLSTAYPVASNASREAQPGPRLSVIIPTFNERNNIEELVRRIDAALKDMRWEAVFVDDNSPDGTAEVVRNLAQKDIHIRIIHRIGRRGLSTACVEGMLASSALYLSRPAAR